MSTDFMFWKPIPKKVSRDPEAIYVAFSRGKTVAGVDALDVPAILDALIEHFPDFEPAAKFPTISVKQGSIEVSHSAKHFRFDFRGDAMDELPQIAEIFRKRGCSLFAPAGGQFYGPAEYPEWARRKKLRRSAPDAQATIDDPDSLVALARTLRKEQEKHRKFRNSDEEKWYRSIWKLADKIEDAFPGGRWSRMSPDLAVLAGALKNFTEAIKTFMPPGAGESGWGKSYEFAIGDHFSTIVLYFLDAVPRKHDVPQAIALARQIGDLAREFFAGDWRDGFKEFPYSEPQTREETRHAHSWIDAYRECLLAALLIDDQESKAFVLAYPDTDLPFDEGTLDLTKMDNQYHIWLAKTLRGEPAKSSRSIAHEIATSNRPRAKLLLQTAESILQSDEQSFAQNIKTLLNNYWKSGYETNRMDATICIEGSILWHLARQRGVALPRLPEKQMDLILRMNE